MAQYRVTIGGTLFGQDCRNVMHIRSQNGGGQQEMEALAEDVRANWIFPITNLLGEQARFDFVNVRNLSGTGTDQVQVAFSLAGLAGGIDNTFPYACFVLRIKTGVHARRGRGRVYIWGIGPGSMSGGLLRPDIIQRWNTEVIPNLNARYCQNGSTFRLGVAPRLNTAADFIPAIGLEISPKAGVQRRRNIGVGN
jgi:hypothetical protein